MDELTPRQIRVLEGVIAEYIRSGKPVGSEYLTSTLDLDMSPATVRNILRELEEAGYIQQPHTSAGRIPSDQGYRFYVNRLVAQDINRRQRQSVERQLSAMREANIRPSRATAKLLSELAHCLAISGWMRSHDVQEAGLAEMLKAEGQNEALQEIAFLLQHVDEYLQQLSQDTSREPSTAVYIGSENPLFDAVHTSSLVRTVELPSGETIVLLMVGPKRMPYQRNVTLLNSVASILAEDAL